MRLPDDCCLCEIVAFARHYSRLRRRNACDSGANHAFRCNANAYRPRPLRVNCPARTHSSPVVRWFSAPIRSNDAPNAKYLIAIRPNAAIVIPNDFSRQPQPDQTLLRLRVRWCSSHCRNCRRRWSNTFVGPDTQKRTGHPSRCVACTPFYCCRYINAQCLLVGSLVCRLPIVDFQLFVFCDFGRTFSSAIAGWFFRLSVGQWWAVIVFFLSPTVEIYM